MAKNEKGGIKKSLTQQSVDITAIASKDNLDVEILEQERPGRPIELTSKRQQKMLQQELKRLSGKLHRGRPIDPESPRQKRQAELAEKRAAGMLKPGRPAYTEEEREAADVRKKQIEEARKRLVQQQAKELLESGKVVFDENNDVHIQE